MTQFQFWDLSVNSYCQKIKNWNAEAEKLKKKKKKELKEAYPKIFSGWLGRCTKTMAKFKLQDDFQLVFKKKQNVPFASLEQINEELDRLVKTGVLSKLKYIESTAPTVYVKKKSKEIRVCADFSTGLNAALKDCHYPLPSPEEIFAKLNGGKFFLKIDLSDAYLQIPVEEESSKLLCINTHRGLYRFECLPLWVKVMPAIFQQVIDTVLSSLDVSVSNLDDILMNSESVVEHMDHVHKVFAKVQDYGFKIRDQIRFFVEKIKYRGHIIDKDGRRSDPERAAAIKDMPAPDNIASLQRFLRLANYYQVFIQNMHDLRTPLNELLKKVKPRDWAAECLETFEENKENTDVRIISHTLQAGLGNHSSQRR